MTNVMVDPREFEAFCRGRPADERYDALDTGMCALGQFVEHKYPGRGARSVNHKDYFIDGVGFIVVGNRTYAAAVEDGPDTFGALADRLAKVAT
jgi:hypothetical protein